MRLMFRITSVCYFYSYKKILSIDDKILYFQINSLKVGVCMKSAFLL